MHVVADVADAFREGITRNYLTPSDAIVWAQGEIANGTEDPARLLAHLAFASDQSANAILRILGQLAWGANPQRVGRIAAEQLQERLADGRLDAETAARAMYHLVRDGYAPDALFENTVRRLRESAGATTLADMLAVLSAWTQTEGVAVSASEASSHERDQITLAVESAASDTWEIMVSVDWQLWAGHVRVRTLREHLASFVPRLRAFAAHEAHGVRFDAGAAGHEGRLELIVEEYGRARRAAVGVYLRAAAHVHQPMHSATELRAVLPTEHALLGDFAADIAELVAGGGGTAQLRLLRRWPDDV